MSNTRQRAPKTVIAGMLAILMGVAFAIAQAIETRINNEEQ